MRIVEEAVQDIHDNVRHVLEPRYSNNSASDSESHPNIVIERVFPFVDLDHNSLADNKSEQREPSLISYESSFKIYLKTIIRYQEI